MIWISQGKPLRFKAPPFVFKKQTSHRPWSGGVSFELVDLTGDGILDIWVDHAYGVAVISFQNGEFKEVLGCYGFAMEPREYVDLDNDGIYEIKVSNTIPIKNIDGNSQPEWMSLYEWNGDTYVLNNERFYVGNGEFLIRLLRQYNYRLRQYRKSIPLREAYSFYIGLIFYYREDVTTARRYLRWVVKNAEKQDYVQAAESILKKLSPL